MLMATAQLFEALNHPNTWALRRLKFIADNQYIKFVDLI